MGPSLDLLIELLHCRKARDQLLQSSTEDLHDVVDGYLDWLRAFTDAYLDIDQVGAITTTTTSTTPAAATVAAVDIDGASNSIHPDSSGSTSSHTFETAAGVIETAAVLDPGSWAKCCGRALLALGLLCDDLPDAQTRIADKGGIPLVLKAALDGREKQQHSQLAKWGCWCLFVSYLHY